VPAGGGAADRDDSRDPGGDSDGGGGMMTQPAGLAGADSADRGEAAA
jgi:hypothetical protein